ncbi:MAG TPA: Fic family protein, partial [Paludibacter sp.]|nr:Fic family protein [Paludibacter sp.]
DLPFDLDGRLFYYFSNMPFNEKPNDTYLNISQDVLSVPSKGKKYQRKCELEIDFKTNGIVKPTFYFKKEGKTGGEEVIPCGEFYMENLRIEEGESFLGIDFGSSNSYLSKLLKPKDEIKPFEYPEFWIKPEVMDSLRVLEGEIEDLRTKNLLNRQTMSEYAMDKILLLVFHSNKIEGNPLSKGETETVLSMNGPVAITKQELEAKNLRDAYRWMIDNVDHIYTEPEAFLRQINGIILNGVIEGGGVYRKKTVSLVGMNYIPPPSISVPSYMEKLSKELAVGPAGRSLLEFAVSMHTKFVAVHPFIDANGRTARLLMNAIFLAGNLPVVVINFDDKQRYLDALSESNQGDISSLVIFISECFRVQLEEIIKQPRISEVPALIKDITEDIDPIADAFREIGVELLDDPLQSIMDQKLKEIEEMKEVEYNSWKQTFTTLLSEMNSICEEFNAKYRPRGFQIDIHEYDMLSFDKYLDILKNDRVSRTWFFGSTISGSSSNVKVLFFFEHLPHYYGSIPNINKVILTLVKFNGTTYERLTTEPLTLRGVAYSLGKLVFLGNKNNTVEDTPRHALKTLLAELIKTYITV